MMKFLQKNEAYDITELADHIIQLQSEVSNLVGRLKLAEGGIGDAYSKIKALEAEIDELQKGSEK